MDRSHSTIKYCTLSLPRPLVQYGAIFSGFPGNCRARLQARGHGNRSPPLTRCPPASAGGFLSNGVPTHSTKSPGREPGDSGNEHRPGCHFDAFFASQSINMATGALVRKTRRPGPVHERARCRRTCGTPRCHRRLLRLMRPAAISRHLPTLNAKLVARVGGSFRSSAQRAAAISGSEDTAGRSRLPSNRRFASGRRPGWLRPREVSPSRTLANRSSLRRSRPLAGRPPTGASSCRSMTTATSFNRHPTRCPRSTSTRCEADATSRLMPGSGEGLRRARKTDHSEGYRGLEIHATTSPARNRQRPARARSRLTDRTTVAKVPLTGLSSGARSTALQWPHEFMEHLFPSVGPQWGIYGRS